MSKAAPSRMGVRRSRRSGDLGGYTEDHADGGRQVAPENQSATYSSNSTSTPRKSLQLAQQPRKPAQSGGKDPAEYRRRSKQALVHAEADAGDHRIVVVGEKAMALTRTEAVAGRDPARKEGQSADSVLHEELSRQADKDQELSGLVALVQAEIERAAEAQVVEHLKKRTAHALKEASALRDELERTEAAVVGSKKKRDGDVADLERQLKRCEEEVRRLEAEVEYHRVELESSAAEGARLGEELKRTQESLLFLSAWDEEKIELESQVAGLKAQLSAVAKEGKQQLDVAQQEFNIITAKAGMNSRLRLERDTEKIKLDLEKGLSEEFKTLRRENDVFRREITHKDSEINRIMRNAALVESNKRAIRVELDDERRMHHTTIRKKKRAEAIITELQAQLSAALSSASGEPFSSSNINISPRRPKKQWGSPRPPAPGRGRLLVRESDDRGGGYREVLAGSGPKSVSKVSMLLVPARRSGEEEEDGRENAGGDVAAPPHSESSAATTTAARRGRPGKPPEKGGRDKRRPSNNDRASVDEEEGQDGDDIPELLPCGSGSVATSGDVWGMLDSYVHRRSEVARANRHLRAIEAMHTHLEEKKKMRPCHPTRSNCSAITIQYDNRGRRCRRVGGENHNRNSDEAVWRASRRKRARQDDRQSEACAKEKSAPSDWRRPTQKNKKTVATKRTTLRVRIQLHPVPQRERDDGSVSSISQVTAASVWKECDRDSTPGKTRSPRGTPPKILGEDVKGREGGGGRGGKENAGRGGTMAVVSDDRPGRPRGDACDSDHGHNNQGHKARMGGALTCPSKDDDGEPPSCVSGDTASSAHHPQDEDERGAVPSVVVRSPSLASSLTSGVVASGRLWGGKSSEATASAQQQGGGGKGLGLKARAAREKAGRQLGTWGRRKSRRVTELADWLETNTNLVNVSPW